uniref:Uncharacterized protein n=1 Tax=Arion vulgaris TaxID=1028688 RepID=A0A0B7BNE2_9EUPU
MEIILLAKIFTGDATWTHNFKPETKIVTEVASSAIPIKKNSRQLLLPERS